MMIFGRSRPQSLSVLTRAQLLGTESTGQFNLAFALIAGLSHFNIKINFPQEIYMSSSWARV